jgi:hypothetical protein
MIGKNVMSNIIGMALRVFVQTDDGKEHEQVCVESKIDDEQYTVAVRPRYVAAVNSFLKSATPGMMDAIGGALNIEPCTCGNCAPSVETPRVKH